MSELSERDDDLSVQIGGSGIEESCLCGRGSGRVIPHHSHLEPASEEQVMSKGSSRKASTHLTPSQCEHQVARIQVPI